MPDKKNDAEIKKALECCISNNYEDCKHCPAKDLSTDYLICRDKLREQVLDLINRLQADVDNYKQIAENQQKIILDKAFENKRLKEEKVKLHKVIPKMIKTAKAEAYKEFAEKMNKEAEDVGIDREGDFVETHNKIYDTVADWCKATSDNLLKELVGEDNGNTE